MKLMQLMALFGAIFALFSPCFGANPPDSGVQSTPIVTSESSFDLSRFLIAEPVKEVCRPHNPEIARVMGVTPFAKPNPVQQADVPDFAVIYNWSGSGKQYALVGRTIRSDIWLDGVDFVGAVGYELTTGTQPSFGFGLAYGFDLDGFYVRLLVSTLFPQNGPPDLAFGVVIGIRFGVGPN